MRYVALIALLLFATGCSGSDDVPERSEGAREPVGATAPGAGSVPYEGAGVDCPIAEPSPITISQATRALRKNAFSVSEIERSCGLHTISAMLTNASSAPPSEVMEREGLIYCFVFAARRRDAPDVVDGDTAAASAERSLANLECDLYGADRPGFEEEVGRLESAFRELRVITR